jgi:hypothetical protein
LPPDLKARGLLADTLVMWGGEFGRSPFAQNISGRDHNSQSYTIWRARGGLAYGRTDEGGCEVVQNPVHVLDWHALT